MKADILSKTKDKLVLNIKGAGFEFVNSVRRSCISSVPTLAIEDVEITMNNSALYDEVLSHRLGLIPLTTDLKTYVKNSECKCKGAGCARCVVSLSLEAKGPCTVLSKDLISSDKSIKPVFDNIPIVKLFDEQEVKLVAKAMLNTGLYHTKHSPCMAYHQYYPVINVLKKKKALDEICPREVFKEGEVNKDNLLKCNLCNACTDAFPDDVKIESKDDNIILTVESWGQLSPEEIYNTAVNNLISDVEELSKQVK